MEFINNHKRLFIIIMASLCIILAIVTVKYRSSPTFVEDALSYIIAPLQRASTSTSAWIAEKIRIFSNFSDIEAENKRLLRVVEELSAEYNRLRLVEIENRKLSELLQIDQKYANYEKTGAEVIGKDMGNWFDRFIINKGSRHGIGKNMVVISSGGLVGTVVEAGFSTSKVISLIDNTSSISAKSVRTDDIGFVKGDIDLMRLGYCKMELLDIDADIQENDEIVTSQLSDIYPPGITIGRVKEIQVDSNGLTKYAVIVPVVDFKHLETILVIYEYKRPME